jgi:hypothetical protein
MAAGRTCRLFFNSDQGAITMAKGNSKSGVSIGTGSAINVELGWVPTFVLLYNTDTTNILQAAWLGWVVPFSSGGTAEVTAGSIIRGNTSGARATVSNVLLMSGTWAAGDAAGFLVLQEGSLTGTFGSETVVVQNLASGTIGTDDATVTANVVYNAAVAAATTAATTAATSITRYEGTAAATSKGFTIGATLSVDNKILPWMAFRDDA